MNENSSREIVLDGAETDAVLEALQNHKADTSEATEEELDDLESFFDQGLDDAEDGEFALDRADARVVLSALEERERVVSGRDAERFASLRERFAEEFDFETRGPDGPEPMEDEEYPGST